MRPAIPRSSRVRSRIVAPPRYATERRPRLIAAVGALVDVTA
jgi:hypothetical protein